MYVVARDEPFHCTTDPFMKPLPLTVSVNPGPPDAAKGGLNPVMVGWKTATAAPALTMPRPQLEMVQELPPGKRVTVFCKIANNSAGVSVGLSE